MEGPLAVTETPVEDTSTSSDTRVAEAYNLLSNSASDPVLKVPFLLLLEHGGAQEDRNVRRAVPAVLAQLVPPGAPREGRIAGATPRRPERSSETHRFARVTPPVCACNACLCAGTATAGAAPQAPLRARRGRAGRPCGSHGR